MKYSIIRAGTSRSFPGPHFFLDGSVPDGDVVVIIGREMNSALTLVESNSKAAVLLELGTECLGTHTGEHGGEEGSNIVGFARFCLGDSEPSNLVELVKQPRTLESAIAAAKTVLQSAGLKVAVCNDFPGRIIDRLVRPYYNAALRRLDERLASAEDMDLTLKLGLGYPEGPIRLLERTGLAHHFDVTQSLYEALGEAAYAPARRACIAKLRDALKP